MRQFDLQPALGSCCPFAENLQDQPGTVDHLSRQLVFEVALLDRGQRTVDNDQFGLVLLAGNPDVVDLACAEQQVRSYIAHWQHEAIGDDHADCQCEPFRFGQARLRIEIIGHPADVRTHDERPGTASDLAHQIIVEAQLSSSSHSSVRSTGVAGWIVETACL